MAVGKIADSWEKLVPKKHLIKFFSQDATSQDRMDKVVLKKLQEIIKFLRIRVGEFGSRSWVLFPLVTQSSDS